MMTFREYIEQADMTRRGFLRGAAGTVAAAVGVGGARGQEPVAKPGIESLFKKDHHGVYLLDHDKFQQMAQFVAGDVKDEKGRPVLQYPAVVEAVKDLQFQIRYAKEAQVKYLAAREEFDKVSGPAAEEKKAWDALSDQEKLDKAAKAFSQNGTARVTNRQFDTEKMKRAIRNPDLDVTGSVHDAIGPNWNKLISADYKFSEAAQRQRSNTNSVVNSFSKVTKAIEFIVQEDPVISLAKQAPAIAGGHADTIKAIKSLKDVMNRR